jgi:hypothetical protein
VNAIENRLRAALQADAHFKGGRQVNAIENRLRAAFRADAQLIGPHAVGDFDPGSTARTGEPGQLRHRMLLTPLAAAAAVAALVVGATVIATNVESARGHASASFRSFAAGYPDGKIPAGKPPKFVAAVIKSGDYQRDNSTQLKIIDVATGRVTSQVAPPRRDLYFRAVAAAGSDRAFIADATNVAGCGTWFYYFTLTPAGTCRRISRSPRAVAWPDS